MLSGITLVFCALTRQISTPAQQAKNEWQRVYTGEESIIEIKSSAVTFQPGRILRAEFRTVFSKPETLRAGGSAIKYKTSLETIDFRMNDRHYRFFEISLLDPAGKLVQKKTADASVNWRALKAGGINERLYNAAFMLTPFGSWRVVDFRFADGNPKSIAVMEELDPLIGIRVNLHFDFAEVGSTVCRSPLYEDKDRTQAQLELDVDWKAIGIGAGSARVVNVRCEGSGWRPPRSLLIKDEREQMLMLWAGVFLVLERGPAGDLRNGGRPTLIKRLPPQRP